MNAAAGGAPRQLRRGGGGLAPGKAPLAGRWTSADLLSTMAVILIMFGITGYAVSARIGYAEENLDELLVEAWEQSDAVTNPAADPSKLLEMIRTAIEDDRNARATVPGTAVPAREPSTASAAASGTPSAQPGPGRGGAPTSVVYAPGAVTVSGALTPSVAPPGVSSPAAGAPSPVAIGAGNSASSSAAGASSATTGPDDPAGSASQSARSSQDGGTGSGGGSGAGQAGVAPIRPPIPPTRERVQSTPQPSVPGTAVPTATAGEELPPVTVIPPVDPAPPVTVPEEPVVVPPVVTNPPESTATPVRTATPQRTATPEPTATSEPVTPLPTTTAAPVLTSTPALTPTPVLTPTQVLTATPTLTPTPTSGYVIIQTNAPANGLLVMSGMRPGDCVTQNVTVSNVGRATFATYSLATSPAGSATSLWTDPTNGLQFRVSRGGVVLYDSVINVPTLDLGLALPPGGSDLLTLSVCLPSAANNSVQGLSQTVSITWTATAN